MRVSTCETQRRQRQDQSQLSLTNICGQRDFISSRRATSLSHFRVLQSADHTRSRRKAGGSFFFFFSPRIQVLLRVFTQQQGRGGQQLLSDGLLTPPFGSAPRSVRAPRGLPVAGERAESAVGDWLRARVGGARRSSPIKVRRRAGLGFASACVLRRFLLCLVGVSLAVRAGEPFPRVMATKAVCVLKGDGPVQGTIHFEAKARAGGVEGGDQRRGRARQPVPWSGRAAQPGLVPPSPRLPPPARGSAGPRSTPPPGPPPAPLRPQSAESPGEPAGGARRGLGGGAGREHPVGPFVCGGAGRPTTAGPGGRRESEGGGEPAAAAPLRRPQAPTETCLALRRPCGYAPPPPHPPPPFSAGSVSGSWHPADS